MQLVIYCKYSVFKQTLSLSHHLQEAINLLEPMTNDPVNYVRQGALIASALIMIQQTEVTCPKVCTEYLYFSFPFVSCIFFMMHFQGLNVESHLSLRILEIQSGLL